MSQVYQIQMQCQGKQFQIQIDKSTTTLELLQFLVEGNLIELKNSNNNNLKFFLPSLNLFLAINQLTLESFLGNTQNCVLELKEEQLQYSSNNFSQSDAIPQKQGQTQPQISNQLQPQGTQHQRNQQNSTQQQQQQQVQQQQVYTQNATQNSNQYNQQFQYNHQTQNQQNQQQNHQVQNQSYNQQQYQQQCRQEYQTNNQQNQTKNTQQNQKKTLTLQYQQNQIQIDVEETLTVDELFAHFFSQFDIEEEVQLFWEDLQLSCLDQKVSIFVQGIQNNSIIKCKLSQKENNMDVIIDIYDGHQIRTFLQKNHSSLSTLNQIIYVILIYLNLTEEIASIDLFHSQDNISTTLEKRDQIPADLYNCTLQELNLIDRPLKLQARVRFNGGSMKGMLY